jgi:hypothetical protein
VAVRRSAHTVVLLACMLGSGACGEGGRQPAEAYPGVRVRVRGPFEPPADGRLTDAQIDMYLRVRRASAAAGTDAEAAQRVGASPAEFDWVRARILEALLALDSRRASAAVLESYGRAIATLREARRGAVDPASAARIDREIAALERERSSLRRPDPLVAVVAANAARIERRRTEIEAAGP